MFKFRQPSLPISWAFSTKSSDFTVSDCNRYAFEWLEKWPFKIVDNFVCLVGEHGSGKTHLSNIWASRLNASILYVSSKNDLFSKWYDISSDNSKNQRYFVLDNADELNDDILLFCIYNTIKEKGSYLLMTAKSTPNRWNLTLDDIKSRMSTVNIINIKKPDEEAMISILKKMFLQRGINSKDDIIDYIVNRIERSYESINQFIKKIDNELIDKKVKFSKQIVKNIFDPS